MTLFLIILGLMMLSAFTYLVWLACVFAKRGTRKRELQAHVQKILSGGGIPFTEAEKLYRRCQHICTHYSLSLNEIGFEGDFDDLWIEVGESDYRAALQNDTRTA